MLTEMDEWDKAHTDIIVFLRESKIKLKVFKNGKETMCHAVIDEDFTLAFGKRDRELVEYFRELSKMFEDTASIIFAQLEE